MKLSTIVVLGGILAFATTGAIAQSPSTVLVVANANNVQSIALADYYMAARQIPAQNELLIEWTAADSADVVSKSVYLSDIAGPIYSKIKTLKQIDYIVLCRNLPTKVTGCGSVDSNLAGHIELGARMSPYYWRDTPFTSAKYGIYLVTRLDGWSWDDARSLVDRSISASGGGTLFLDVDTGKSGGYIRWNNMLKATSTTVKSSEVQVSTDTTATFVNPGYAVAGYASWGSNDSHFNAANWKAITFVPGAIAETAVSTSATYLRTQPTGGQSQISQLIRDGVTGVKGYVAEPFLTAIADPSILFARYTGGRNLAESFYAASSYVCWQDVVIGDPLCRPYDQR
jgi:uncharacterized protein (TIGR03790 family)